MRVVRPVFVPYLFREIRPQSDEMTAYHVTFDFVKHVQPAVAFAERESVALLLEEFPVKPEHLKHGLPMMTICAETTLRTHDEEVTLRAPKSDIDFSRFFEKDIPLSCATYFTFLLVLCLSIQRDRRVFDYCPNHPAISEEEAMDAPAEGTKRNRNMIYHE